MPGLDFLPMIKVRTPKNQPWPRGIQAARAMVQKRVPDEILYQLMGPTSKEAERRVRSLILWTGGYPRQMIQLLRAIIAEERHPISQKTFESLLMQIANEYQEIVPGEAYAWLARVHQDKALVIEDDTHRRIAAHMLSNHVILRYLNDSLWFDLHPAVLAIPGVQAALAAPGEEDASS